jgi:hypothetical protein
MKRKYMSGEILNLVLGVFLLIPLAQASHNESVSKVFEGVPDQVWGIVVVRNLHEASCWLDGYCRTLGIDPLKLERAWVRKLGLESAVATNKPTALVVLEPTVETPQPFALGFSVQDTSSMLRCLNARPQDSSGVMEGYNEELGNCFWIQNGSHVLLSPSSVVLNRLIHLSGDPFGDMMKTMEQKKYDAFLFLDRAVYLHWTQQGGNKIIPTTRIPQDFSRVDHNSIQSVALGLRLNSKGIEVVMDIEVFPNAIHHWQMLTPEAYENILVTIPKAISEILFQKPMPSLDEVCRMSPLQVCSKATNTMRVCTTLPIEEIPEGDPEESSSGSLPELRHDSQTTSSHGSSWFSRWRRLLGIVGVALGAGLAYRVIRIRNTSRDQEASK